MQGQLVHSLKVTLAFVPIVTFQPLADTNDQQASGTVSTVSPPRVSGGGGGYMPKFRHGCSSHFGFEI